MDYGGPSWSSGNKRALNKPVVMFFFSIFLVHLTEICDNSGLSCKNFPARNHQMVDFLRHFISGITIAHKSRA